MFESLFALAWKSALFSVVVAGLFFALRRNAARDRARLLAAGMGLLMALPLLAALAPSLTVEVAVPSLLPASAPDHPAPAVMVSGQSNGADVLTLDAAGPYASEALSPVLAAEPSGPDLAALLPEMLFVAYLVPAAFFLLHLGAGLIGLSNWSAAATPVRDPAWTAALKAAARRMGLTRTPRLLRAEGVCPPVSFGLIRPTILVDAASLERIEDAEAVLSHECAHLARQDWPVLLVSRTVRALFWFNPLVWWLDRQLEQSLEEAADDRAVAGLKRTDYAQALLNAARDRHMTCPANGAGSSSLEQRLTRLFGTRPEAAPRIALGALVLCAGIAAPVAALQVAATEEEADKRDLQEMEMAEEDTRPAWDPDLDFQNEEMAQADPVVTEVQVGDDPYPPEGPVVTYDSDWTEDDAQAARDAAREIRDAARNARDLAREERDRAREERDLARLDRDRARAIREAAAEARAAAHAQAQASAYAWSDGRIDRQVAISEAQAERIEAQVEQQLARAESQREHALARAKEQREQALAQAEEQIEREVAAAMKEMRRGFRHGADEMMRGADDMERGAGEMEREAEKLRHRDYREKVIAEHRARGEVVTHEELIDAIAEMREGAVDMRRGAEEMREGAAEMRRQADEEG